MSNLERLAPAKQVAAILAACHAGDVPSIPPFLIVTPEMAERRRQWNKDHPLQPTAVTFSRDGRVDADKTPEALAYAKRAAERKAAQEGVTLRRKDKLVVQDMTGFHWDHRRGRFVPDGYEPPKKLTTKPTEEELKLAAAQHARNAQSMSVAKVSAAKAKVMRPDTAAPAKREAATNERPKDKARPGERLKGESTLDCFIRLMKRPEGVTLAEASAATGNEQHSLWASVTRQVRKQRGHTVIVNIEDGARIFRIGA